MPQVVRSLVLSLLLCSLSWAGCPFPCSCKWKNGKQTIECINKELLVIPEGMDSSTQVLEFMGNNLQSLHQEKFLKMDLINLQRIYLSKCRITNIDDRAFKGLTNLVELDLSGNLLVAVPTPAFLDCPSLMRLTLSFNPIKSLARAAFNHLSFLNTLELSHCEISSVDEGAFQGLYSLEWLHLNDNKMSLMEGTRHLPVSLKGVQLQENPWECDCHILELHAWLKSFNYPHSIEPVCAGPTRLRDNTIKAVATHELACLPNITPTMFYLKIEEGKNLSLVCQVHAVPEAKVSWWFQGQLLQNDSTVAPGVHLLYYIEDGTVEKRSELFIYNANTDDNGTFICNAENPAGTTQANFTIKVVVKHEEQLDSNEIPFEFMMVLMSSASLIFIILLIIVIILSVMKCRKNARLRKMRNNSKDALRNTTKDNLLQESIDESIHFKEGSNIKLVNHNEGMTLYATETNDEIVRNMSPLSSSNQVRSPTSLKCYQIEQNPDLINGTESIINRSKNEYNLSMFSTDMHLNPVELLNTGGRFQAFSGKCYRTLPYNRVNKRQTAANPLSRISREAEFLCQTQPAASYEQYDHQHHDVRYTADGYPVMRDSREVVFMSSPAESHKSISSTSTAEPCCSSTNIQWPACVPANLSSGNIVVVKKCVGAQTQTESPSRNCDKVRVGVQLKHDVISETGEEILSSEC